MATAEKYCVVLPAATPLFLHVFYGIDRFLNPEIRSRVRVHVLHEAVSDIEVASRVATSDRIEGRIPLAGICDPRQAADFGLDIHGAIVKRLGFLIVSRTTNNICPLANVEQLRYIYTHAPQNVSPSTAANTALELANNLRKHFALRNCEVKPSRYDEILVDENSLVITANLPLALYLQQNGAVRAARISDAFPEWSRLFLSAVVSRSDLGQEEKFIFQRILSAIQGACRYLRFGCPMENMVKLLKRYFRKSLSTHVLREHLDFYGAKDHGLDPWLLVAQELTDGRITPSNLEVTRFGAHLADALWCDGRLAQNGIFYPRERPLLLPVEYQASQLKSILKKEPITGRMKRELGHGARLDPGEAVIMKRYAEYFSVDQRLKDVDVLIVTALEGELEPFRKYLFPKARRVPVSVYGIKHCYIDHVNIIRNLTELHESRRIGIISVGVPGRITMAMVAANIIEKWRPKVIVLAGIAAGFKEQTASSARAPLRLGDVLVPNMVVDYESQKIISRQGAKHLGFRVEFRDVGYHLSQRLHRLALDVIAENKWRSGVKGVFSAIYRGRKVTRARLIKQSRSNPPNVRTPEKQRTCLFCGDKVIAAKKYLGKLFALYPEAMGVDMESSAIAAAVEAANPKPDFIVLKAVSDFADWRKSKTNSQQEYAIASSASFVNEFIRHRDLLNV